MNKSVKFSPEIRERAALSAREPYSGWIIVGSSGLDRTESGLRCADGDYLGQVPGNRF